jgi:hypothetical protein
VYDKKQLDEKCGGNKRKLEQLSSKLQDASIFCEVKADTKKIDTFVDVSDSFVCVLRGCL